MIQKTEGFLKIDQDIEISNFKKLIMGATDWKGLGLCINEKRQEEDIAFISRCCAAYFGEVKHLIPHFLSIEVRKGSEISLSALRDYVDVVKLVMKKIFNLEKEIGSLVVYSDYPPEAFELWGYDPKGGCIEINLFLK